ncbi:MAG: type III pantothenate kinase [Verrucomicrobia bacterium]|nr:type III pantothenate kinase [Verrucomicrobiota bacterium]
MSGGAAIVVDVGNTRAVVGLVRDGAVSRVNALGSADQSGAGIRALLGRVVRGRRVDGAILGSVVPDVNRRWQTELRRVVGRPALVMSHKLQLGVGIDYPRPASIGADRLANASGAVARYGWPVIVADFGTALTFDVVNGTGAYTGGVIVPGLPFMTDYLSEKTALLPHIQLTGSCGGVGRSTKSAMRIGAQVGYRGMVREIVNHLKTVPGMQQAKLCATGGYAEWVLKGLDMPFVFDPELTLFGLGRIYSLNASS